MAPRSRTGCLTCRSRKLKCSEERPVCSQCAKSNRECIPASGITFRHQQNPSMNGASLGEGSLRNFYGYKETFGKNATWVEVPNELTFIHTTNPFEDSEHGSVVDGSYLEGDTTFMTDDSLRYDESTGQSKLELAHAAYPAYATHGLEALSAVASQNEYNFAAPPALMGQQDTNSQQHSSLNSQAAHSAPSQNIDYILNPPSVTATSPEVTNLDPQLHSASPTNHPSASSPDTSQHKFEHVRTQLYNSSHGRPSLLSKGSNSGSDYRRAITEPELAFFLRDYAERMGLWMDIFDDHLFFSTKVPVLAAHCPLLLYSCAALSAKALARVNGRKPVMSGQITITRQSKMERWPGLRMSIEAWMHRARQFYDLAVSLLRQALAGASRPPTSALPEEASPGTISNVQGSSLPSTDSDELFAATAVLCVYEFFDVSGAEWNRHLDGTKSLFDIANDRMQDLTRPQSPVNLTEQLAHHLYKVPSPRPSLSAGRKAVFWCFARQDMLSAYINNTTTRVDTADLAIWRSAGLKLAPDGLVYPSNPRHPDFVTETAMSDEMIGNAFIWLLAKLVNFILTPNNGYNTLPSLNHSMRQAENAEIWEDLNAQLNVWYEGLPDSFAPTAIQRQTGDHEIPEKWFPRSMCASTMQWWHFARIQLLHNKPQNALSPVSKRASLVSAAIHSGVNIAQRHASYSSMLRQSREHAKEIVAIGLGRHDEGTRVHSVQPLWVAGLVLGTADERDVDPEIEMWRRSIVKQLRGIERDMGWASEYRVQSLLELWQLPADWIANEPD